MIFVWNGKQANAMVKASAMTKGYELDDLVVKAKDSVLKVLFSGGVIRGKKLQRGSVFVFADVINQRTDREEEGQKAQAENPQQPSPEELKKAYETVYLLKWLFPPQQAFNVGQIEPKYSNFSNQFNVQTGDIQMLEGDYWQKFDPVDELPMQPVFSKPI